jgi:hypothetical protein
LDNVEIIRRFEQVKNNLPERGFFFPQVFSAEKKPTNNVVLGGLVVAFTLYIIWVVAFKPASLPDFTIEPPPERQETISGGFNVACIAEQKTFYPACYQTDLLDKSQVMILPLPRNMQTIMEFEP